MTNHANLKVKKPKTKVTVASIREDRGKDHSPSWEGCEQWTVDDFTKNWHDATRYYNLEFNYKDHKIAVVKWMLEEKLAKETITSFKRTKDVRCSSTMGTISSCLLKGMPEHHPNFNKNANVKSWLLVRINDTILDGKNDTIDDISDPIGEQEKALLKQHKIKEFSLMLTEEIEDTIEAWNTDPDKFDPKKFKVVSLLRAKSAKPVHLKLIKDAYEPAIAELIEVLSSEGDGELKEGYSHHSRKQINSLLTFYKEVTLACDTLIVEATKTKIPPSRDKMVSKLKYLETCTALHMSSINPVDIIGSSVLWCVDVKTRKLYRYVSDATAGPLSISGSTIIGFDVRKSIGKTLKDVPGQLLAFSKLGMRSLDTFMDGITTMEILANGKITPNHLLLKVA
jgi:hypothetical protein